MTKSNQEYTEICFDSTEEFISFFKYQDDGDTRFNCP